MDSDKGSFKAINDNDSEECVSDDMMSDDFNQGSLEDDTSPTKEVIKLKDRIESLQH